MDSVTYANSSVWKKYGFAWVTFSLFLVCLLLHWVFGWYAYVNEQNSLGLPIKTLDYSIEMLRDTLENWQSEFLQLVWQVMGLAMLLYIGSPQSKEGDDRMEAKLDLIIEKLDPAIGKALVDEIDQKYTGRHTDVIRGK
jgi:hypothetical protein